MATDRNARENRDLSTREKETRHIYKPGSILPDPTPIPGVEFRYIATAIMGQSAERNVSEKFREGWVPVLAKDHPELHIQGNANGNVEIGGLMLCRNSKEAVEAKHAYFEKLTKDQMISADNNFMGMSDPRMPVFSERRSETTRGSSFGSGTR